MPIYQYLIVTTLADKADLEAGISAALNDTFSCGVPVYTATDAAPRTPTHALAAIGKSSVLTAYIELPSTTRADFPDTDFTVYDRSNRAYLNTHLASLGLTIDQA